MSPPFRKKNTLKEIKLKNARDSAVLLLLYKKYNDIYIVLTERKIYEGAHSGQISFPGGKKDKTDLNLMHTALREAKEEIGVDLKIIETLCALTNLYIPVSNYIVYPFVAVCKKVPFFIKNEYEVENILEVKLSDLLNIENQGEIMIGVKNAGIHFNAPSYNINKVQVWGATAMILSEFLEIVK